MRSRYSWLKLIIQTAILLLVGWGIYHSVRRSTAELARQQSSLREQAAELRRAAELASDKLEQSRLLEEAFAMERSAASFWRAHPGGLLLAALLYGAGMLPAALFWKQCLGALGQSTDYLGTAWAYFYGNLGKYFPGKAMVVILRLAALEKFRVQRTATSITIFMETLTLMAVGGAAAAVCLILLNLDWRLTALALGLLAVTFAPTFPPVLRQVIPRLQRGVPPAVLEQWTQRVHWRLIVQGWLLLATTWLLFGLSLTTVLLSLPGIDWSQVGWTQLFLSSLGACALAVVLGFVSLLPGGAGVREVVLSMILAPVIGPTAALCSALWMRIVWLATEVGIVGLLAVVKLNTKPRQLS